MIVGLKSDRYVSKVLETYVYYTYASKVLETSEVEGKEALADPNREIGFGFVSCSCRACVRAGEAKLRERVRDDAFSSLVARIARCAPPVTWIWW